MPMWLWIAAIALAAEALVLAVRVLPAAASSRIPSEASPHSCPPSREAYTPRS